MAQPFATTGAAVPASANGIAAERQLEEQQQQQHDAQPPAVDGASTTSPPRPASTQASSPAEEETPASRAISMDGKKSQYESEKPTGSSSSSAAHEDGDDSVKKEEPAAQKATFGDLFYRFSTPAELALNVVGLIFAIAAGVAQPLMTVVFGNLTSSFLHFSNALTINPTPEGIAAARNDLVSNVNKDALYLLYVGIAMGVSTYIYMGTWVYTGESITRRIRLRYLGAVLRQDIAYFDTVGAGEITTRIQSDIQLIQEGISDKVPISVMFVATFVAGFVVAYVRNARLAGVLTAIVPCIIITGAVMNVFMTKFQQIELQHVSRAATIAEEALSTVRTAKAFGVEHKLVKLYDEPNRQATTLGVKKAIGQGIGMGLFFFVIYSAYALAFFYGCRLIADGQLEPGVVMTCIFAILIGSFGLAMLAPNLQALAYALGAGGKVFETIDRVPPIDSASTLGLKPSDSSSARDGSSGGKLVGAEIELENVHFSYPARAEVQILNSFNLTIPRGKTTALVGASGSGKSTIVGLVERFYDPDVGCVRLDGIDLRDLNLIW